MFHTMHKMYRTVRTNWGKDHTNLPQMDLTLVQRESYQWFLEHGIKELLSEITPIVDFTGKIGNFPLENIFLVDLLSLRLSLWKKD